MDKKRASNFSSMEESVLVSIIAKYKGQVECKKSDVNTNKIKADVWAKIANEYNVEMTGQPRDSLQLRKKYENLKKRAKQKYADEKIYRSGTGGGPFKPDTMTDVDETLKEIAGDQLTGFSSVFDSDRLSYDEPMPSVDLDKDVEVVDILGAYDNNTLETRNWSHYSPDMLRAPVSAQIDPRNVQNKGQSRAQDISGAASSSASDIPRAARPNAPSTSRAKFSSPTPDAVQAGSSGVINKPKAAFRNPITKAVVNWGTQKVELVELQKEALRGQNALKLELMRKEHDAKVEWQYNFAKEEHNLKMKIMEEKRQYAKEEHHLKLKIMTERHTKEMETRDRRQSDDYLPDSN